MEKITQSDPFATYANLALPASGEARCNQHAALPSQSRTEHHPGLAHTFALHQLHYDARLLQTLLSPAPSLVVRLSAQTHVLASPAHAQALDDDAFNQFVIRWKKKLRGIAYKTAGEQQYEDVVQEAWLMAHNLRADGGSPLDLSKETDQQRLLAYSCLSIVNDRRQPRLYFARVKSAGCKTAQAGCPTPLPGWFALRGGSAVPKLTPSAFPGSLQ